MVPPLAPEAPGVRGRARGSGRLTAPTAPQLHLSLPGPGFQEGRGRVDGTCQGRVYANIFSAKSRNDELAQDAAAGPEVPARIETTPSTSPQLKHSSVKSPIFQPYSF